MICTTTVKGPFLNNNLFASAISSLPGVHLFCHEAHQEYERPCAAGS